MQAVVITGASAGIGKELPGNWRQKGRAWYWLPGDWIGWKHSRPSYVKGTVLRLHVSLRIWPSHTPLLNWPRLLRSNRLR